ncbi:MAG: tetratricopeptide repeat protein [bacterium]|nr:tetratricopeptide repeat protein [bacterium]
MQKRFGRLLRRFGISSLCALVLMLTITPALAQPVDCRSREDYRAVGEGALLEGDYAAAVEAFTCVIQLAPNDGEGYIQRSEAALLAGDYMMALSDRAYGLSLAGGSLDDSVLDTYNQQVEENPDDTAPLTLRAFYWLFQGDYARASEDLNAILKLDYDNTFAWLFRALTEQSEGTSENAETDLSRAAELGGENPSVLTLLGVLELSAGNVQEGLDYFNRAIDLDPQYPFAYMERASFLAIQGENADAINDFTAAIDSGYLPLARPLLERANLYTLERNYDRALDDYNALIELDPDNLTYYQNRAGLFVEQGDYAGAVDEYTRIIEIEPENANNFLSRGTYSLLLEDMDSGANDFLTYVRMIETEVVDGGELTLGETETINMALGRTHEFTFEAAEGDLLDIRADSPDRAVDPLIIILDEDGNPIFTNDDVDAAAQDFNALIEAWEAPADGTYTLLVSHAAAGSDGEVEVTLDESRGGSDL